MTIYPNRLDFSSISLAFYADFTSGVHTALHIACTSAGCSDMSVSIKLSDSSKRPTCKEYLVKVLEPGISTPSLLMTVAYLTCTYLYCETISILSYSVDSVNAIRINLRLKQVYGA